MRYPVERLRGEVAQLAMRLGWTHDDILKLTHTERLAWLDTIHRQQGRS